MGKKLAALLLAGCLLLAAAGCGAKDVLEDVGTEIKADGRAHGQTTSHSEGETAKTAFFEYTVNSARMEPELEDYTPTDPNHTFVVVNITVKNTFDGMLKKEFYFPSSDGQTQIHVIQWFPEAGVKAVLQISHGMVEYIDPVSYTHLVQF